MKGRLQFRRAKIILLFVGVFLTLVVALAAFQTTLASGVRYAAPATVGTGDCSSWENACTLQTALTGAAGGDEIWVQAGLHYPGGNRTDTFTLQSGVAVYGGFSGNENTRDQRDWEAHITVLSGDIDQNDQTDPNGVVTNTVNIQGENAYHVTTGSGANETAVLDGFVITAGQADGEYPNWDGAGMTIRDFSSPTLVNLTFSGNLANSGGGMANLNSNPTLTNVSFNGNLAVGGGGIYNQASSPTLTEVVFTLNDAVRGGGMHNSSSSNPVLTDVTFTLNSAYFGGGMYNDNISSPTLRDVYFNGNSANRLGGGMFNIDQSSPVLINVTFGGNTAGEMGGGMANWTSWDNCSPLLINVTFSGNTAGQNGGGMSNYQDCSPTLLNVTFSGNTAGELGGGLSNLYNSNPIIANSILWGNTAPTDPGMYNIASTPTISSSDIQGCGGSGSWNSACGTDGGGNIEMDPLFVDPANSNLRLQLVSLAIDAGNNASLPPDIFTDLDGNPRMLDIPTVPDTGIGTPPIVDLGAFEAQVTDVTIGKAVLPMAAAPGEAITFTLTLTNTGTIYATDIIVTDTLPAFLGDVTITSTLNVTDTGTIPPFVWAVQDLAPGENGGIIASGMLSVPLAAGTYTNTAFITAVGDMYAENNSASISFTVHNVAPVFASVPVLTAVQDETYTYAVSAQDDNGDALAITAPTLPGWLTLTDHGDGTATLSGTPDNVDVGAHGVVLKVADTGDLIGTQSFTVTVANINDAPAFTSTPTLTATQDVLYSYAITADDPDLIHGDALTITATTLPAWLTLTDHGDGTATLAGTPTNADVGPHTVVLRATDGGGLFAEQTFTVTVANMNDAPEFISDPVTTATQDLPYTYVVTADDPDLIFGDVLTITSPILPAWLTLTDHGDGTATLTGTPADADVGTHTVVLHVVDGGALTDTQTFTIVVWARIFLPITSRSSP